jgi:hypothetical protein
MLWKKGFLSMSSRLRLQGREDGFIESENGSPVRVTGNDQMVMEFVRFKLGPYLKNNNVFRIL